MPPEDPADEAPVDPELDRIYDLIESISEEIPVIEPDWGKIERTAGELKDALATRRRAREAANERRKG